MKPDQLSSIIQTTESAIRYLLSGFVVTGVSLLSLANPKPIFAYGTENPLIAIAGIGAVGFVAFSIYRLAAWSLFDGAAFLSRLSAPAVERTNLFYSEPYSKFLLWRFHSDFGKEIGGYLTYRWSVAHFSMVTAISLISCKFVHSQNSLIHPHSSEACWAGVIIFAFALWQISFLFRVERSLYIRTKKESIGGVIPIHSNRPGIS